MLPRYFRPCFGASKTQWKQMGVSKNGGTPKSSILIGFSIINHPFWGTPIFGNTQIKHQYLVPKFSLWQAEPRRRHCLTWRCLLFASKLPTTQHCKPSGGSSSSSRSSSSSSSSCCRFPYQNIPPQIQIKTQIPKTKTNKQRIHVFDHNSVAPSTHTVFVFHACSAGPWQWFSWE